VAGGVCFLDRGGLQTAVSSPLPQAGEGSDRSALFTPNLLPARKGTVLVDRAAEEGAERAADQGASGAVAAAVDDVAEDAACRGADDQAGRAVAALAIILAVRAAIDLIVGPERAFGILRARDW